MSEHDPADLKNTASTAKPRAISRERMILLFSVMLVTAAGNTAMQSVMPSIGTQLGVADVWISLAYTWSALLWVICAPIWARRSDQRGRKSMMALGMVGFISSMGLCGLVLWFGLAGLLPALWTLLLFATARSLYGGFGSAAPPAVQAYVAARTPRSERTNALSLIASSFGLGTVLGPALAPLLIFPGPGLTGPFLIFAGIGVVALIALRWRLPNDEPQFPARGKTFSEPFSSNTQSSESDDDEDEGESDAPPKRLSYWEPRVRPWVIAGLLGGHAQAMVLGIVGFLVLDRLGLRSDPLAGAGPVGVVLMAGALATLVAQWGVIPRFNLGPRAATLGGITLAGFGTLVFAVGEQLHTIALGYALASLGFGLFRPGTTSGTSLAVTRREQGEASGIVASVAGAAFIFAPALGVLLYNLSEPLAFGLVISLCAVVFAFGWKQLTADEVLTRDRR
jgi:MFS family permease